MPSWLGPVLAVGAATVLWGLLATQGAAVGIYWGIGLGFGLILQRSRLCFAGAFRDLVLSNDGRLMRAILAGMMVATLGFSLLMARFVPNTDFGLLPPNAHVLPVGFSTLLGGVLFGVGMVLAGGCVSGTVWRMGEGYLNSWVTMAGILGGLWLSTRTWNWWWRNDISRRSSIWLPNEIGFAWSVVAVIGALAVLYVAVLWWESRSPRFAVRPKVSTSAPAVTVRDNLRAGWRAAFGGNGWPYLTGAVSLSVLNVFSVPGGDWLTANTGLTVGLLFGAFVAAVLSREFKLPLVAASFPVPPVRGWRSSHGLRRGDRHRLHHRRILLSHPFARPQRLAFWCGPAWRRVRWGPNHSALALIGMKGGRDATRCQGRNVPVSGDES